MGFIQDYITIVCLGSVCALAYYLIFMPTQQKFDKWGKVFKPNATKPTDENIVTKIKRLYNLSIQPFEEKVVPISSLWLYPVRGIKGFKVKEIGITPYGPKNDRQWVIIDKIKGRPLACDNSDVITFLRQKIESGDSIEPIELKLMFQDNSCFPDIKKRNHILRFDKDYSKSEYVECAKGYRGYKEDDDVNQWLSDVFEEEVFLIRAEPGRLMNLDKERLPSMQ